MKWRALPLQLIETMIMPSCLVECRLLFELTLGICAGLLKGQQPQKFVVRNRKSNIRLLIHTSATEQWTCAISNSATESRMKENPKPCGCLMGFKIKEFWNIFGHHWMILSIQKKRTSFIRVTAGYCTGCRSSLFAGLGSSFLIDSFLVISHFPLERNNSRTGLCMSQQSTLTHRGGRMYNKLYLTFDIIILPWFFQMRPCLLLLLHFQTKQQNTFSAFIMLRLRNDWV